MEVWEKGFLGMWNGMKTQNRVVIMEKSMVFKSSWIIGPGVGGGTWGLLEDEPGKISWCWIMEALANEVLQNDLQL